MRHMHNLCPLLCFSSLFPIKLFNLHIIPPLYVLIVTCILICYLRLILLKWATMESEKEVSYLKGYAGSNQARELLKFVRGNKGLESLLPSMIQRCDNNVNKMGVRIREWADISERLIKLQSVIDGKFKNCTIYETITRNLEGGIGITLALPNPEGPIGIKQLNKDRLVSSVRLDLARHSESPYSDDPLKVYIRSGVQLLTAIGWTEVNRWGKIVGEDLDGIRLFLDDGGRCFGSEIKFNGPGMSIPKRILTFNESHQSHIDEFKTGLTQLSFLG